MAKNLLFDCSYTEIWVHPKNWKTLTSKKSLALDWYVQCKFIDPLFLEDYPKGFPFRKKLNKFRTLEERKEAIQLLLEQIPILFEDKGWNPITKMFMIKTLLIPTVLDYSNYLSENQKGKIIIDPQEQAEYSIDNGVTYQDQNVFLNLDHGEYFISVRNIYNELEIQKNPDKIIIENLSTSKGKVHPQLNFIEALRINYTSLTVSAGVKKEMKRIIAKVHYSAKEQNIEFPICEMHSGHVRDLLDYLNLTPNEYNKYLTHLSIILSDLVEKRMVFHNPIRDIKKKKTLKKIRNVFEVKEAQEIFDYLRVKHPEFFRYGMIFFHSGSRTSELFRLQAKNVFLKKREFKLIIEKGNHSKEVLKPILPNVLEYWIEILKLCESKEDYLFTRGLKPSLTATKPYQITKRFKRLVKDKLVFKNGELIYKKELEPNDTNYNLITADFYSLKHLFLDELDRIASEKMKLAGKLMRSEEDLSKFMAGHTTDVTERVYLFGREGRKNDVLKNTSVNIIN